MTLELVTTDTPAPVIVPANTRTGKRFRQFLIDHGIPLKTVAEWLGYGADYLWHIGADRETYPITEKLLWRVEHCQELKELGVTRELFEAE